MQNMNDSYTCATPGSSWTVKSLQLIQGIATVADLDGKSILWDTRMEWKKLFLHVRHVPETDRNKGVTTLFSLTVPMASAPSVAVCLQTIRCRTVCHEEWLLRQCVAAPPASLGFHEQLIMISVVLPVYIYIQSGRAWWHSWNSPEANTEMSSPFSSELNSLLSTYA